MARAREVEEDAASGAAHERGTVGGLPHVAHDQLDPALPGEPLKPGAILSRGDEAAHAQPGLRGPQRFDVGQAVDQRLDQPAPEPAGRPGHEHAVRAEIQAPPFA